MADSHLPPVVEHKFDDGLMFDEGHTFDEGTNLYTKLGSVVSPVYTTVGVPI